MEENVRARAWHAQRSAERPHLLLVVGRGGRVVVGNLGLGDLDVRLRALALGRGALPAAHSARRRGQRQV